MIFLDILNKFFSLILTLINLNKKVSESKIQHKKPSNLIDHTMFSNMKRKRDFLINRYNIVGHPVKTAILKDIVIRQIDLLGNELYSLTKEIDQICKSRTCNKICQIQWEGLIKKNNLIMSKLNQDSKLYHLKERHGYTEDEKTLIELCLEELLIHQKTSMAFITNSIKSISTNQSLGFCANRQQSFILSGYNGYLNVLTRILNKTSDKLEGGLESFMFRERFYPPEKWQKELFDD